MFSKACNKGTNSRISQKLLCLVNPCEIILKLSIFKQNCNGSSQFKELGKLRKTKIKLLISIKKDFLIQIDIEYFWSFFEMNGVQFKCLIV